ncbi:glucokinase [Xanthobacter variabilis]|uniref:glucokinase n=1 Tax=Xanthobacter variabilis TaxID=3119932 RepID=UPI003728B74A
MAPNVLIADIGGTTTRIARSGADGVPFDVRVETNDSYVSAEELIGAYLDDLTGEAPRAAVLAVAGPVEGDDIRLTNRDWHFSRSALGAAFDLKRVEVINDFAAFAHGVPQLGREDLLAVGVGRAAAGRPRLVCGPGTGFGTALILTRESGYDVLPSEAGHMRFGAVATDEARIIAHMVRDLGPVVVEHVLSGGGLVRMHRILTGEQLSSHAIIKAAANGQQSEKESCAVFLRVLGRVLGDLTLAFEALGGVYVGGGLGRALAPLFTESPFRAAFEDHPPYGERLAQVPVHVVTHAAPGLLGTARLGRRLLQED